MTTEAFPGGKAVYILFRDPRRTVETPKHYEHHQVCCESEPEC